MRVNRVAKVVKGGKRFSFSALVVVGDRKGKSWICHRQGRPKIPEEIRKAVEQARKKPRYGRHGRPNDPPMKCATEVGAATSICSSRPRPEPASSPAGRCGPCSSWPAFTISLPSVRADRPDQRGDGAVDRRLRFTADTSKQVARVRGKTVKENLRGTKIHMAEKARIHQTRGALQTERPEAGRGSASGAATAPAWSARRRGRQGSNPFVPAAARARL